MSCRHHENVEISCRSGGLLDSASALGQALAVAAPREEETDRTKRSCKCVRKECVTVPIPSVAPLSQSYSESLENP